MLQASYERRDKVVATAKNDTDRIVYRAKRATVDLRWREALRLYRGDLDARPNETGSGQLFHGLQLQSSRSG